jgi:hypothetical protein
VNLADALRSAENDLQRLREQMARVARFIADPAYDDAARRALAQTLGLPEPALPKGAAHRV